MTRLRKRTTFEGNKVVGDPEDPPSGFGSGRDDLALGETDCWGKGIMKP